SCIESGYSLGQVTSFHIFGCGGVKIGLGTNLFQALGKTLPLTAMAPIKALSMNRERATCQPPLLPEEALRQLWVLNRVPAVETHFATSSSVAASTRDSLAANSNVYDL